MEQYLLILWMMVLTLLMLFEKTYLSVTNGFFKYLNGLVLNNMHVYILYLTEETT